MSGVRQPADAWRPILAAYPAAVQPHHVEYLEGAAGFSGAEFWRLKTASGPLCLRHWPPEHPSAERLTLIHRVLRHAAARGLDFLPVPLATRDGRTFVGDGQRLWELTPWLPGEGDFSRDGRPEKLRAALAALAQFHMATADFPSPMCKLAPSPSIAARLKQVREWTPNELARLVGRISNPSVHDPSPHIQGADAPRSPGRIGNPSYAEIISLFQQLAPRIESELSAVLATRTKLQPAIRDVWADHILFLGDEVTGLIDFGGLNIDTPATDVARLLGSMAGDDASAWQMGLAAYESIRPLLENERALIPIFDRSTVTLSGMNWLRWLHLEGRTFADPPAIAARLAAIVRRMRWLAWEGEAPAEL